MTTTAPVAPTIVDPIAQPEEPQCRHHWVIQPASGPFSLGTCQTCGEAREFKNYVEASTWGDNPSYSRVSADVARAISGHVEDDEEE